MTINNQVHSYVLHVNLSVSDYWTAGYCSLFYICSARVREWSTCFSSVPVVHVSSARVLDLLGLYKAGMVPSTLGMCRCISHSEIVCRGPKKFENPWSRVIELDTLGRTNNIRCNPSNTTQPICQGSRRIIFWLPKLDNSVFLRRFGYYVSGWRWRNHWTTRALY